MLAEPRPQLRLLGAATGEQQVQPRVGRARPQEALGEQVDALLAGEAAGVEDLDLAGIVLAGGLAGVEARDVDAALPATEAGRLDAEREQRAIRRRARREHQRGRAVEGAERRLRPSTRCRRRRCAGRRRGQLGVVAGDQRRAGDPVEQGRGDAGRPGSGDVDGVVAALGQGLDQVGQARNAEAHPGVEGDLELGRRRQPPVDAGVGADDLDLEAGHAELADLLDRRGDAVHGADPVGDQGDPRPLAGPSGRASPSRRRGRRSPARRARPASARRRGRRRRRRHRPRAPPQRPRQPPPRRRRSWVRRARR